MADDGGSVGTAPCIASLLFGWFMGARTHTFSVRHHRVAIYRQQRPQVAMVDGRPVLGWVEWMDAESANLFRFVTDCVSCLVLLPLCTVEWASLRPYNSPRTHSVT